MTKEKTVEIACKIETPADLEDLDHLQCAYQAKNDFTDFFRSLYEESLQFLPHRNIHRIYYGSEFCEFRIPAISECKAVLQKANQKKLPVTFLTPPVTQTGIERIKALLPILEAHSCEISVNDYGVLQLLHDHHYHGNIICGRILDKLYHDGRMNRFAFSQYTNEMGYQYLRSPAVSAPSFQEALKKYYVTRYDIDLPQYGLNLPENQNNISYSTFLPYGYITTGRICMMRNYQKDQFDGFDLTKNTCHKVCRQYDQLLYQPVGTIQMNSNHMRNRSVSIMRKGNTLFYGCTDIIPEELQQFDRIILQPKLML